MMQVGVFAKTFAGTDPDQVLGACRTAGFESVQYNMACSGLASLPSSIPAEVAHAVKTAADSHGIEIAAVSATYNMINSDLEHRKAERRSFESIAKIAGQMGTSLLTVCSGSMHPTDKWQYHPSNGDPKSWIEMCKEFELLLELAEQNNIFIGVEPEQANIVSSAQEARRLLDEFAGSRIRIVLDPANIVEDQPPNNQYKILDEAFELLGPEIALAHAKDRAADGTIVPAGTGMIGWHYFLRGLKSTGFSGPMIAHGISPEDAPDVADFLRQEIEQLQNHAP